MGFLRIFYWVRAFLYENTLLFEQYPLRRHLLSWLSILITGLGMIGCESEHKVLAHTFSANCWHIDDTVSAKLDRSVLTDSAYIYVTFKEYYAYRNIYLKINLSHPTGWKYDTLMQIFVVDTLGFWNIAPRNNLYTAIFPAPLPLPPDTLSFYRYEVLHYMRDSALCEIAGTGVTH